MEAVQEVFKFTIFILQICLYVCLMIAAIAAVFVFTIHVTKWCLGMFRKVYKESSSVKVITI